MYKMFESLKNVLKESIFFVAKIYSNNNIFFLLKIHFYSIALFDFKENIIFEKKLTQVIHQVKKKQATPVLSNTNRKISICKPFLRRLTRAILRRIGQKYQNY